MQEMR